MKLSRLFPLLALLLAASLHAENTHKEVRIASPWPAQNTIIAMLGYGDNIVGTSMIAKRIPLFRQSLPRIEKVAAVSVNSGHEINPEQIIALTMTVLESTLSVENRYRQLFRQRLVILAVIFIAIIASLLLDFTLGPSGLPLHSLIKTLMHPSGATNGMRVIVWDIRLPYALMALLVGMALGLAGAEMQTILNNSLASPFTLGVSSAAAFGAALAIVLGIGIPGVPESGFIPANAFLFALLSALLLDSLTRWTRVPTSGVVLFGIALVFTFNALVSIMQFVWCSGRWAAWLAHHGRNWRCWRRRWRLFYPGRCVVPGSLPSYASAKSGR